MYRSYEDPYGLERQLKTAVDAYEKARASGYGPEDLIDEMIWIQTLKDRINFAWQDQEFDAMQAWLDGDY